jgi:hypothetical protein
MLYTPSSFQINPDKSVPEYVTGCDGCERGIATKTFGRLRRLRRLRCSPSQPRHDWLRRLRRLRCWASQPRLLGWLRRLRCCSRHMIGCDAELRKRKAGWLRRLRYLILQPSKPKNSQKVKLIVATNHFISITYLTLSVGVSLTRTWSYATNFLNSSFELQEFKFYVYWSLYTIE